MGCWTSTPINKSRVDQSHFEVYRSIGRGGYGAVDVVQHRRTGEIMAMKRSYKDTLVDDNSAHVVWIEREVMSQIPRNSPFLVPLLYAFQSPQELFLVMPYLNGGDLTYHLQRRGTLSEEAVRFYAAEIIIALEELHLLGYIYRDMKPDNCLLDSDGHVHISDYGLCVRVGVDECVSGYAGTKRYTAPEILNQEAYRYGVDYWSLGATLFELLHCRLPFESSRDITDTSVEVQYDRTISEQAQSLLNGLLERDGDQRLGHVGDKDWSWAPVKQHTWFSSIDWSVARARLLEPPFKPDADCINAPAHYEAERQLLEPDASTRKTISLEQQERFRDFSWNVQIQQQQHRRRHRHDDDDDDDDDVDEDTRQKIPLAAITATTATTATTPGGATTSTTTTATTKQQPEFTPVLGKS